MANQGQDVNAMIQMSLVEEPEPQQQKANKKRKTAKGTVPSRSFAQAFTLAGIRTALHTEDGVLQLIQTLKDNGCTVPDQKMAEMLQFIMSNVDIVTRGPMIPSIPKREVTQVLEYVYPNPGEKAVYRPGKSFTAVMKSLMRTIGVPDNIINGFAGSKRNYKFITWTPEGQQKAAAALQMTPEQLSALQAAHAIEDDDEEEEDGQERPQGANMRGAPGGMVAAFRLAQKRERASLRKGFTPKYDVLFSRTTWTYYIRVFMPMCDPSLLQQGITLDMYKGHLSLKGRYSVTPTLPPWTTQNEPIGDLEVVQPLPPNACGDFAIQIPLPFDVDRSARKEVHVTDIGLIVSLKRLKEEIPQMEFKVHSFANAAPAPAGQPAPAQRR